ncbi:MAG: Fe-S-cluster containining protein [Oceanicoccus sp.]|jgi:Fe-S-cluster containining protein
MTFKCRSECGACCIAPSIAQALPGMPAGKPAGVVCVNLDEQMACRLFGKAERPLLCEQFKVEPSVCGDNRQQALQLITLLEQVTQTN